MSKNQKSELPEHIPIFPLSGVLLLPCSNLLPLHIFEPRYRAMVEDAVAGNLHIGMIQPRKSHAMNLIKNNIYDIGCLGRIQSFRRMKDGRFFINLLGVCRFKVANELELSESGYRQVIANYDDYEADLDENTHLSITRSNLYDSLRDYAESKSLQIEWGKIGEIDDETLINAVCMTIPLRENEKQLLLEADNLQTRYELLISLLDMESSFHGDRDTLIQ